MQFDFKLYFLKKEKILQIILYALLAIILASWFYIKIINFNQLYYTSDLFSHLQMSKSWTEGKPLLYENAFGEHAKLHNYYFDLILAPLTILAGAYGLFIAHFLFLLLAVAAFLIYSRRFSLQHRLIAYIFLITFVFGPISYWIWDNPYFGWHIELLYVPFSLLFSIALLYKKKWMILSTGFALCLIREDGAVLGACIHLFYFYLVEIKLLREKQKKNKFIITQFVSILIIWILIFVIGIFFLFYKNDFEENRLTIVLSKLIEKDSTLLIQYFPGMLLEVLLLLTPALILILLFFRKKNLLIIIFLAFPILIVNAISASWYLPYTAGGLTMVPRFSLIWGFFLAAITMLIFNKKNVYKIVSNKIICIIFILIFACSYYFQFYILKEVKDYNIYQRVMIRDQSIKTNPDVEFMKCIAANLPENYYVAPPYQFFAIFHRHQIVWWGRLDASWQKPDLIICAYGCKFDPEQLDLKDYKMQKAGIFILFSRLDKEININECIERLNP